ncbi:MAG: COX15/CtaA family protein [Alphaproteobacteria bacterium]|nr:COX15/CtaA family protein [Alphaproteobacteria bacterium]MDE2336664.1 COX15/CtaA family protein [Alphaproteobacteria bacterium]
MQKTEPAVARWLFFCAAFVFFIAVVGAITRLTESGLSIVEWQPVTGAVPPLTHAAWMHEFALYKASPQYKMVNAGMDLAAFKHIFFWEWFHRLIDRLLGVVYALPLALFWARGKIPPRMKKPLLGILLLGGLQGLLGWYMVKSGLVHRPSVSHYRLAAHLMLAILIYCCFIRAGCLFGAAREAGSEALFRLRTLARVAVGAVAVTMTWGAFTAGLRAGLLYDDTFPYMGKRLWPGEMFFYKPWWINLIDNPASVQFTHRVLAVTTFSILLVLAGRGLALKPPPRLKRLLTGLALMAFVQVGLGVSVLLTHVDIIVAVAHQAGAMTIMALLMLLLHNIPRGKGA